VSVTVHVSKPWSIVIDPIDSQVDERERAQAAVVAQSAGANATMTPHLAAMAPPLLD
jgi:hypothetical protein